MLSCTYTGTGTFTVVAMSYPTLNKRPVKCITPRFVCFVACLTSTALHSRSFMVALGNLFALSLPQTHRPGLSTPGHLLSTYIQPRTLAKPPGRALVQSTVLAQSAPITNTHTVFRPVPRDSGTCSAFSMPAPAAARAGRHPTIHPPTLQQDRNTKKSQVRSPPHNPSRQK